jgi:hypothetical protein
MMTALSQNVLDTRIREIFSQYGTERQHQMKLSLTFLAGIPVGIGITHLAGINSGAPMFFAGVLAVLVPVTALLSSKRRVRTLARFLNAAATSNSGIATRREVSSRSLRKPVSLTPKPDPLVEDVVSALVNAGARPSVARKAAIEASRLNRDFESAYRGSLQIVARP